MRIAYFTNSYHPAVNGVVTSIRHFAKGLTALGHEVHIFAPQYDESEELQDGIVHRVPALDFSKSLNATIPMAFKPLIESIIHEIRPQIIHSQHPVLLGKLAANFSEDLGVPLVFTFHSQYEEYARGYFPVAADISSKVIDGLIESYLKKCSHVIVPTPPIIDYLDRYEVALPVSVVPTPIDLEVFQDPRPEKVRARYNLQDKEVLLYLGRLSFEKNLEFLLHSFARIRSRRPRARLLLAGEGPVTNSLKKLAEELSLKETVIFTGLIGAEQMPDYIAAADLFVFPSISETQGLVLLESMAGGTPVVALDSPATKDVLTQGGGLLVSGGIEAFAQAVESVLGDDDLHARLSSEGRSAVKAYTIPAASARLADIYADILHNWQSHGGETRPPRSLHANVSDSIPFPYTGIHWLEAHALFKMD